MGLTDFRFHCSFFSHHKYKRLRDTLGHEGVVGLLGLWSFAAQSRPSGDLSGIADPALESVVDWRGKPGALVRGLVKVGFIDGRARSRRLHNWCKHQPWVAGFEQRSLASQEANRIKRERKQGTTATGSPTPGHRKPGKRTPDPGNPDTPVTVTVTDPVTTSDPVTDSVTTSKTLPVGLKQPDLDGSVSDAEQIKSVFAHYRTFHPRAHKSPTSKSKEWKLIKARLAEGHTEADLCEAINGCHRSPWHMGENDRDRKYDSLELIMRDGSKVAQFMEVPHQRTGLSDYDRKLIASGQAFIDRKTKELT